MKKALFISNTAFSLFAFRLPLMMEMKKRGWDVVAVGMEDTYAERIRNKDIRFQHLFVDRKGKNPIRDLIYAYKLYKIYRKEKPRLVHQFTIKPVIYGSVAAALSRVKNIVNTVTGLGSVFIRDRWITALVRCMYRVSLRFSSVTIFQNADDRAQFVDWGLVCDSRAKIVLGSGVDTEHFKHNAAESEKVNSTTYLMVSRLLWDKGVREFIEAAGALNKSPYDCKCVIAGGVDAGNPSSIPAGWIERECARVGVEWLGEVDHEQMRDVIDRADVVVLPSYREGLPRALLEAMSMSKPVITTDTVGCREVVVDGKSGFIVPLQNSEQLVEAMVKLAEHEDLRDEMGRAGRKIAVERYATERIVAQTLDVYRGVGAFDHDEQLKKVLYVGNSAMSMYIFRKSLMSSMLDRGWAVVAVGPADEYVPCIEEMGVRYIPMDMDRKGKNPIRDGMLFYRLLKLYRKEKPDLIHNFTIKPVIYGSVAAKVANMPSVVNTITGLGYVFTQESWLARIVSLMYRVAIRNGSKTMFLNDEDINYFINRGIILRDNARLLLSEGVDTNYFSVNEKKHSAAAVRPVTYLMASRMLWNKGVMEYVEACEAVRKQNVNTRFLLVGGSDAGNPESVPEKWLNEVNNKGVVEWRGAVMLDEMQKIMKASDIVVLPSYYREGVPRVLLEAASMGKPIVTTDNVGCRDVVINEKNGYLVPTRNAKALADAMIKLASDNELRQKMGDSGRRRVLEIFDERIIIGRICDIYREVGAQIVEPPT